MVERILKATPDDCYAQFCDASRMRLWVPDLKQLKVVRSDERGRPLEVTCAVGETLTFALVYAYDDAARKVRWVPSAGVLDGVCGSASFTPHADGCLFTYSLDSLRGRSPEHAEQVADAFVAWIAR